MGKELWIQRGSNKIVSIDLETKSFKTIHQTSVDPIGQWCTSWDGSMWMVSNGDREIRLFRNEEMIAADHSMNRLSVRGFLSEDGRKIVYLSGGKEIRSWDLAESPPIVSEFSLLERAHKIALNPSGERLFVTTKKNEIQIYDTNSGVIVSTIDCPWASQPPVFSVEGRLMIIA